MGNDYNRKDRTEIDINTIVPEDRRSFDDFISRSVSGSRSRNEEVDYVSKEKYNRMIDKAMLKIKRALVIGLATGVFVTSAVTVGGPALVDKVEDLHVHRVEISEPVIDFHRDVVSSNTYRVNENRDYAYYYDKIAESLNTFHNGDFDRNVFYCLRDLGPEQTSKVLDETGYKHMIEEDGNTVSRSLRNYLYEKNFYEPGKEMLDDKAYEDAIDSFEDMWENRIIIESSIDEAEEKLNEDKQELNTMLEDHDMSPSKETTNTKGGI